MFELGELHGKALGTAFQKEQHNSLQRRVSFVLIPGFVAIAIGQWAFIQPCAQQDWESATTIHISIHVDVYIHKSHRHACTDCITVLDP